MNQENGKKFTIYHGPMFCGKTGELIYQYYKLKNEDISVTCIKPLIDDRYGEDEYIHSHDKLKAPAKILKDINDPVEIFNLIPRGTEVVIIDEIMFLSNKIIGVVEELLARNVNVVAGGIRTDSDGKAFGSMEKLIEMADHQAALYSSCDHLGCITPATMSYAKKLKESQIEVGASEMYGACCDEHHLELNKGH